MKQFQFEYKNINNFRRELARVRRFCNTASCSSIFFQIFTKSTNFNEIYAITDQITRDFPTAYYYGCQSYGNIIDGKLAKDNTLIVCSIFEYETTKTELVYIDPTNENADFRTLDDLWNYCNEKDWVKAIEFTSTYYASELLKISEKPINLREDIQVFGGVAIYPNDIVTEQSFIFTRKEGFSDKAAVAILLGGEDLNISCSYYNGWEGLGKHFTITKCDGKIIHEIDHEPAMEIYRKYLGIEYNDKFLNDTMKFPLLVRQHGVECIRMPMPTENSGDIKLTVEVQNGTQLRLSYGEPSSIIKTINQHVKQIFEFAPETIRIYSCAIRRNFWGDDDVSKETSMLDGIAATIGFYTRGEILRVGNYLQYFNATIVACLVREGDAVKPDYNLDELIDSKLTEENSSNKLLHYLSAVTGEIESQYNRTLSGIALTYRTMLSIDLKNNTILQLDEDSQTTEILGSRQGAANQMEAFIENFIISSQQEKAKEFCDLTTIKARMKDVSHIEYEIIGKSVGWFRAEFVIVSYDENNEAEQILFTTQIIDEVKRREENLRYLAATDQLTGLYNRRTYEQDIAELKNTIIEDRLVYVSVDVNGLKKTNDTLGHLSGDELIKAAATCMKQAFGSYGRVYRIGGDEFVAIIYASPRQLEIIRKDFENLIENQNKELNFELSVATGYVSGSDIVGKTISEIEQLGDDYMYKSKELYYEKRGISRR